MPQRDTSARPHGTSPCTALWDAIPKQSGGGLFYCDRRRGHPLLHSAPIRPSWRGPPTKTPQTKQKAARMPIFKIYSKTMISLLFLDRNGAVKGKKKTLFKIGAVCIIFTFGYKPGSEKNIPGVDRMTSRCTGLQVKSHRTTQKKPACQRRTEQSDCGVAHAEQPPEGRQAWA